MLKVLTAAQMREVDRLTTTRYGIPSIILMENAAHAAARVITEKLGGSVRTKSVLILCGPGNNGGDGAALARILERDGAAVHVELFGKVADTKGDARTNFETLKAIAPNGWAPRTLWFYERTPEIADDGFSDWLHRSNFDQCDLVVDALFGTGLSRPLDGFFKLLAETLSGWKRTHPKPVFLSIDIPSGLSADSGSRLGENIEAHYTVTFTAPKLGNTVAPAGGLNGELTVAAIGSPATLVDEQPAQTFLAEIADASGWLQRSRFENASYKNKRGHALMIAGSTNYTGAAVLCGDAGIRSGCGLVTIATPESSRDAIVARVSPEVMVRGISETAAGSAAEKAVDEINGFLKGVDVIAVGSGLSSKEDETRGFIRRVVEQRTMPVVIDADGLTALSPWSDKMRQNSTDQPLLILTPHEGEFRNMLGVERAAFGELIKDRAAAVRDFATRQNVILVLKGERSLIGAPDGRVVVNPTGNSGLGKAGNGDTLTGILAGFIAQAVQAGIDLFETVVAAVYVAGMAGDVAEKKYGKRVMTASDVRECLADVFSALEQVESASSADSYR